MENKKLKKFLLTALATSSAVFPAFDAAAGAPVDVVVGATAGAQATIKANANSANVTSINSATPNLNAAGPITAFIHRNLNRSAGSDQQAQALGITYDLLGNDADTIVLGDNVDNNGANYLRIVNSATGVGIDATILQRAGYATKAGTANPATDALAKAAGVGVALDGAVTDGTGAAGINAAIAAAAKAKVQFSANNQQFNNIDLVTLSNISELGGDAKTATGVTIGGAVGAPTRTGITGNQIITTKFLKNTVPDDTTTTIVSLGDATKWLKFQNNDSTSKLVVTRGSVELNESSARNVQIDTDGTVAVANGKTLTGTVDGVAIGRGTLVLEGAVTGNVGSGKALNIVNFSSGTLTGTLDATTVNVVGTGDNVITGAMTATNLVLKPAAASSLQFAENSNGGAISFPAAATGNMILKASAAKALNGTTTLFAAADGGRHKLIIGDGAAPAPANVLTLTGTVNGAAPNTGILEITTNGKVQGDIGVVRKLDTVIFSGGEVVGAVTAVTVNVTATADLAGDVTGAVTADHLNFTSDLTGDLGFGIGTDSTIGNVTFNNNNAAYFSSLGTSDNAKTLTLATVNLSGAGNVLLDGVGAGANNGVFTITDLNLQKTGATPTLTFARNGASTITNLNLTGDAYTLVPTNTTVTNLRLNNLTVAGTTFAISGADLTSTTNTFTGSGDLTLKASAADRSLAGATTLNSAQRLIVGAAGVGNTLTLTGTVNKGAGAGAANTANLEITDKGVVSGAIGNVTPLDTLVFSGGKATAAAAVKATTIDVTETGSVATGGIQATTLDLKVGAPAATFTLGAASTADAVPFTGAGDLAVANTGLFTATNLSLANTAAATLKFADDVTTTNTAFLSAGVSHLTLEMAGNKQFTAAVMDLTGVANLTLQGPGGGATGKFAIVTLNLRDTTTPDTKLTFANTLAATTVIDNLNITGVDYFLNAPAALAKIKVLNLNNTTAESKLTIAGGNLGQGGANTVINFTGTKNLTLLTDGTAPQSLIGNTILDSASTLIVGKAVALDALQVLTLDGIVDAKAGAVVGNANLRLTANGVVTGAIGNVKQLDVVDFAGGVARDIVKATAVNVTADGSKSGAITATNLTFATAVTDFELNGNSTVSGITSITPAANLTFTGVGTLAAGKLSLASAAASELTLSSNWAAARGIAFTGVGDLTLIGAAAHTLTGNTTLNSAKNLIVGDKFTLIGTVDKATDAANTGNLTLAPGGIAAGAIGNTKQLDVVDFAGGIAQDIVKAARVDVTKDGSVATGAITAGALNFKNSANATFVMRANSAVAGATTVSSAGAGGTLNIDGNTTLTTDTLVLANTVAATLDLTSAGVWTATGTGGVTFAGIAPLTLIGTSGATTIVTPKVSLSGNQNLTLNKATFRTTAAANSPSSVLSAANTATVVHAFAGSGGLYNVDPKDPKVIQVIGDANIYTAPLGAANATYALGGTINFAVDAGTVAIPATPNGGVALTRLADGTVIDFSNKNATFQINADGFSTNGGTFQSAGGNKGTIQISANNVTLDGTFNVNNNTQVATLLIDASKSVSTTAQNVQFGTEVKFGGDKGALTITGGSSLGNTPLVNFNNTDSIVTISNPALNVKQNFTGGSGNKGTIVINQLDIVLSGTFTDTDRVNSLKINTGFNVAINTNAAFQTGALLEKNATLKVNSGKSFTGDIDALTRAGEGIVELNGGTITGDIGKISAISAVNITGDTANSTVTGSITTDSAGSINFTGSKNFTGHALNTPTLNLSNTGTVNFMVGAATAAGSIDVVNFSGDGTLSFGVNTVVSAVAPTINTINLYGDGKFISVTPLKPSVGRVLTVNAKANGSLGYQFGNNNHGDLYAVTLDPQVTDFTQVIMDNGTYIAASDVNTAVKFAADGTLQVADGKQILSDVDSATVTPQGTIQYKGVANIVANVGATNPIKAIKLADLGNANTIADNVQLGQVINFGGTAGQILTVGDGCAIENGVIFNGPKQTLNLGNSKLNGMTFNASGQAVQVASGGTISINPVGVNTDYVNTSVTVAPGATVGFVGSDAEAGVESFIANGGVTFTANVYHADKFILNGGTSVFNPASSAPVSMVNLRTSNAATLDLGNNKLVLSGNNTLLAANTTYIILPQNDAISIDPTLASSQVAANQILQVHSDGLSDFLTETSVNDLEGTGGSFTLSMPKDIANNFTAYGSTLASYSTSYDDNAKQLVVGIHLDDKVIQKSGHVIDGEKPFGLETVQMLIDAERDPQQALVKSASTDTTQASIAISESTTGQMVGMLNLIDNSAGVAVASGSEYNNDIGISVFATPFMANAKTKLNGSIAGNNSTLNGLSLAMMTGLNEDNSHLGLGIVVANSVTKFKDAKQGDKTKGDTKALAIFADHAFDNAIVMQGVVAFGVTDYSATEGRYTGVAKGKYTSKFASVLGRVGYNLIANENCKVMPYVGLRYDGFKDSAYSLEIQNANNLQVDAKNTKKYIASIGAKLTGAIDQGASYFAPFADVAFGYNFAKKSKAKVINLGNFNPDIAYADTDKTLVNGRVGVEAKMENGFNVTLGGGMDIIGNKTTVYSGSLKLGYKF